MISIAIVIRAVSTCGAARNSDSFTRMFLRSRSRSVFTMLCAFVALWLASGCITGVQARANAPAQGIELSVTLDAGSASAHSGWQPVSVEVPASHGVALVDDDADEEMALLSAAHVHLDYLPSRAPRGVSASPRPAPAAALLRPPRIA
ncbi:hypothetical protein [Dyella mobilis]|uniref:Uncharacterized protein n=1 Tax=Dyella mobilis TaxID=1849582 RepID=A0ABS2KJY4_9GAMM|nr:hypothetical protein [Dyella mobilis]MBM7131466.1 hypothetical protein [Dyella mobilis]GLQ96560.1 hypothetical protein GCM10007863_09780 [Dyella mobilis]